MRVIVNVLCVVQFGFLVYNMFLHGFPSVSDSEFWPVVAITCLPIAVFFERWLGKERTHGEGSLISLEIKARKAKLRREIDELEGKGKQ